MVVILTKIATTALVVFILMMMTEEFCNHENPDKGIKKHKVPEFVPYVGVGAAIIGVVCIITLILSLIWS